MPALVVAVVLSLFALTAAARPLTIADPCAPIIAACQQYGFIHGSTIEGNRLEADCVNPIVQGRPPSHVNKLLPPHEVRFVEACRAVRRTRR
jgi:hypothetical protein